MKTKLLDEQHDREASNSLQQVTEDPIAEDSSMQSIARKLMEGAGPLLINGCALYSSSFMCSIFVSTLGIEYIAASSYANRARYMFMIIPSYFFIGIQGALKSSFKSSNPDEKPSIILLSSLVWMVPITGLSMLLLSQSKSIFSLLGAEAEDARLLEEYSNYFVWSVPSYMMLQLMTQTLSASNRYMWVIPLSLMRAALDIGLTYNFVLKSDQGFSGWPLANTIQGYVSLFVAAALLLSPLGKKLREEIGIKRFSLKDIWTNCEKIFKEGIFTPLQIFILATGGLCLTIFAGKISEKSLAAYGITSSITYWSIMLSEPFATTACLLTRENNDNPKIDNQEKRNYAIKNWLTAGSLCFLLNFPLSLAMIVGYRQLSSLYLDPADSQEELQILSTLLPLYSCIGPLYSFKYAATGLLRSSNKTLETFYVELVCSLAIGAAGGAIFAFSPTKSIMGLGASEIIGTAMATALLSLIVLRQLQPPAEKKISIRSSLSQMFLAPNSKAKSSETSVLESVVNNKEGDELSNHSAAEMKV